MSHDADERLREERRQQKRLARYERWKADQNRPVKFAAWNTFSRDNGVAAIDMRARAWIHWFRMALSHRRAALLLWDDFVRSARQPLLTPGVFPATVGEQAVVSMGFSVENLLKGIVASDRSKVVVMQNGRIHRCIATHDMVELVEEAGLSSLPEGWEEFLDVLSRHVEGHPGRYPIPADVGSPQVVSLILHKGFLAYFEEMFTTIGAALFEIQRTLHPPLPHEDRALSPRDWMSMQMQCTAPSAPDVRG